MRRLKFRLLSSIFALAALVGLGAFCHSGGFATSAQPIATHIPDRQPQGKGGGMDGGGGGVLAPDYVDLEEVKTFLELYSAGFVQRWALREQLFFEISEPTEFSRVDESRVRRGVDESIRRKAFGTNSPFLKTLRDLKIELRTESPCLDRDGNHKQASIYANTQGAICVSLWALRKKLDIVNYQAQLAALIIHEVGHLIGLDEREARSLQRLALVSLAHQDAIGDRRIDLFGVLARRWIDAARDVNSKTSSDGSCKSIRHVMNQYYELASAYSELLRIAALLPPSDSIRLIYSEPQRAEILTLFACSRDRSIEKDLRHALYGVDYEIRMKGGASITAAEYFARKPPQPWAQEEEKFKGRMMAFAPITIANLTSSSDVAREFDAMISSVQAFVGALKATPSFFGKVLVVP